MPQSADDPLAAAAALLDDFAAATGLDSPAPVRRYLWTDAFAVCTWLGLHAQRGEIRHLDLARELVDQVHRVLGRHRPDDPREGWISGLDEEEGSRHPTAGGLRIGKPLPERRPGEPYDPREEWERDGQYHHYLTRWMHALDRAARVTRDTTYHRWAAELARATHRGFRHREGGDVRLHWKMSIDLSRSLVPSMGHHDPLDGLVAAVTLRDSPARDRASPDLSDEITELARLCSGRSWATADLLGLGGLLTDALFLSRLVGEGREEQRPLFERIVSDAQQSLRVFRDRSPVRQPAERRLAFRELGLAIGLRAAERLHARVARGGLEADPLQEAVAELAAAAPLGRELESFWLAPSSRAVAAWTDHEDINAVTLAASLAPGGYLGD